MLNFLKGIEIDIYYRELSKSRAQQTRTHCLRAPSHEPGQRYGERAGGGAAGAAGGGGGRQEAQAGRWAGQVRGRLQAEAAQAERQGARAGGPAPKGERLRIHRGFVGGCEIM